MAVGDVVRTIREIRTFDPKTLQIRPDGIPSGSLGTIVVQNDADRFIQVNFEFIRQGLQDITRIAGVFGVGLVDTIDNSLEFITIEPAPELLSFIQEESTVALESTEDLALQTEELPVGEPVLSQAEEAEEEFLLQSRRTEAIEQALARTRRLGFEVSEERLEEFEQFIIRLSDLGISVADFVLRNRFGPEDVSTGQPFAGLPVFRAESADEDDEI